MKPFPTAMMLCLASLPAVARADDLHDYIVERAAACWTAPVSFRGAELELTFDVRFRRDGHVDLVQIVRTVPDTAAAGLLAREVAGALQRCGPYVTEGMRDMTLSVRWPL